VNTPDRLPGWVAVAANVLFGFLCAVLLAGVANRLANEGRGWVLDLVAGAAVSIAALARRRYPLAAPIAGLAVTAAAAAVAIPAGLPSEPGPAAVLALMVLAYSAVRVLPAAAATAIALCGAAVAGAGRFGEMLGYQTSETAYTVGAECWLLAVSLGLWLRYLDHRRRSATEAVRRDERLDLARELHDVVAHHIAGILLQTQAARITARRQQDPDALDATLEEIEAAGGEALAAMRRVVGLLRDTDDGVTTGTGTEQLTALVKRFDGHGPAVTLVLPEPQDASWPPEVASTVYRVVQESLTNIARHAVHARSACVEIARDAHGVTIEVTDDAQPGSPRSRHRGGFGLVGMRERVEALGGTLKAGPRPAGAGWTVTATLPVPGERR
jgi:signal transduction histidine kinase